MASRPLAQRAQEAITRALAAVISPIYGGIGSIVMLHRIADEVPSERVGWGKALEVTTATLESIIGLFRKRGYAFLSLDEVRYVLQQGKKSRAKFVSFTFDDGYRDVYTKGFPSLAGVGIPFALYVTTGYPDKTVIHWWYLLEELLLRERRLTVDVDGRRYDFLLRSRSERELAFAQLSEHFRTGTREEIEHLAVLLFGAERTRAAIDELSIRWEDLATMATHRLVTLGAHTLNHPNLQALSREEARHEMLESKRRIEARIGGQVRHFAYPFGGPNQATEREFELATECGFQTATTTRLANIFTANRNNLLSLPRLHAAEPRDLEVQISGAISALRFRGRRAVSA